MTDTAELSTRAATVANTSIAEIYIQCIAARIAMLPRIARGRILTFLLAPLVSLVVSAPAAAAHDGWFVRVCPAKTETNRIYLAFSGNRQGFSWSWIKGRTADEIDLPGRFRSVARITMRGITTSTPNNIQPHAYVCIGFRDISFSGWNSTITKIIKRIGTILMIVPASRSFPNFCTYWVRRTDRFCSAIDGSPGHDRDH